MIACFFYIIVIIVGSRGRLPGRTRSGADMVSELHFC